VVRALTGRNSICSSAIDLDFGAHRANFLTKNHLLPLPARHPQLFGGCACQCCITQSRRRETNCYCYYCKARWWSLRASDYFSDCILLLSLRSLLLSSRCPLCPILHLETSNFNPNSTRLTACRRKRVSLDNRATQSLHPLIHCAKSQIQRYHNHNLPRPPATALRMPPKDQSPPPLPPVPPNSPVLK
jgi:hypothetical protein